jgi:hypothetical protein
MGFTGRCCRGWDLSLVYLEPFPAARAPTLSGRWYKVCTQFFSLALRSVLDGPGCHLGAYGSLLGIHVFERATDPTSASRVRWPCLSLWTVLQVSRPRPCPSQCLHGVPARRRRQDPN